MSELARTTFSIFFFSSLFYGPPPPSLLLFLSAAALRGKHALTLDWDGTPPVLCVDDVSFFFFFFSWTCLPRRVLVRVDTLEKRAQGAASRIVFISVATADVRPFLHGSRYFVHPSYGGATSACRSEAIVHAQAVSFVTPARSRIINHGRDAGSWRRAPQGGCDGNRTLLNDGDEPVPTIGGASGKQSETDFHLPKVAGPRSTANSTASSMRRDNQVCAANI